MKTSPAESGLSLPRRIHFAGICGRVTGGLAVNLKAQGWRVTGTDLCAFPPMSGVLEAAGIQVESGDGPFVVPADTDVIVTGSATAGENTGVPQARAAGIPAMHLPAFLKNHLFAGERRLVVAGTNGKSTTTSMLTWILEARGLKPDYLIGARSVHFPDPVRMQGSAFMVLEGDEYIASQDDPVSKFHFYDPEILILTNIGYDHAEVFADAAAVESSFADLVRKMPPHGIVIAAESAAGSPLEQVLQTAPCRVVRAGWGMAADIRLSDPQKSGDVLTFTVDHQPVKLKLFGRMNALNAALAMAAARECGVDPADAAEALGSFHGVTGRCEVIHDTPGLTIVADEGYHPMALAENLKAMRLAYPGRRLIAVLQARYTGGRGGFQHRQLPDALKTADLVILTPVFDYAVFPGGPLKTRTLAAALKRSGIRVHVLSKTRHLPRFYQRNFLSGDVLFCSLAMRQELVLADLLSTASQLAPA